MKNFFFGLVATLSMASCSNTETKKQTVENPDGTVSTVTTTTEKTTTIDSAKVNKTAADVKSGLDAAGKKIDSVAKIAGKKIDKAGEDLNVVAKKGAEKADYEARKAKENLKQR